MNTLTMVFQNPLVLFWWLSIPLSWWMRTKILTEKPQGTEGIDKTSPVLYVLPFRSFSDLLVLYHFCLKLGLPLPRYAPKHLRRGGQGGYLYLSKLGLLQAKRSRETPTPLQNLCLRLERDVKLDVQIVPVSIIWGRNPGSHERSLFKLLFPDDEHAGILQKLLIILAQGRNTVIHFGAPIAMREQVDQGPDPEQVSRKLRRVLRVHFRNQRNITLGPKTYDRNRVMRFIFDSPAIQQAIDAESKRSNTPREKVEPKVRHYLKEISAAQAPSMVRFFDVTLTYVWNKIYDGIVVRNADSLREIAHDHEIVYVTSHRSHLDYLVLPYELYHRGFATPHTAAGVNLSFWPLGTFLRRGGGFFIRRSFRGNRLYTVVLTEYLNYLIIKGHPMAFFPEGGRSRTGRLLPPKTGLLSMIVQGYLRDPAKPVAFIPVYVGYDKVAEVKSYLAELRGATKKKEGFADLVKLWKVLTIKHGKAYLGFGAPVFLDDYLDKAQHDWRKGGKDDLEGKPKWFTKMVTDLAFDTMCGVNSAALVSRVSLVSVALLSSPQRAVAFEDFDFNINALRTLLLHCFTREELAVPRETTKELLKYCEEIAPINKFEYPGGGDVIYLNEIDASLLLYYRNNIIHLFAYASLLATYLQHVEEIKVGEAAALAQSFHDFLARDLFLNWTVAEASEKMAPVVEAFEAMGVLTRQGDVYVRVEVTAPQFGAINTLARLLSPLTDRYAVGIMMLHVSSKRPIKREDFEKGLSALTQKFALLKGISDPEVLDRTGFKNFNENLRLLGYVKERGVGELEAQPPVAAAAMYAEKLLDNDMLRSIRRQFT